MTVTWDQHKKLDVTIAWDQRELDMHNAAWKAAKEEMLGSAYASVPDSWFHAIACRAEVIRQQMKTRKEEQ